MRWLWCIALALALATPAQAEKKNRRCATDKLATPTATSADSAPEQSTTPDWQSVARELGNRIGNARNPFAEAGVDADAIGRVHQEFREILPIYTELASTANRPGLSRADYVALAAKVEAALASILSDPKSSRKEQFAAMEALRLVSIVEAKAEPPAEKKSEEQKDSKNDPKNESQQEQQQQKDKGAPQPPNPWQEQPDRYEPKNKDLSSGGDNADNPVVLRTTEEAERRLLRQRIFDVVTAREFVSNAILRPRAKGDSVKAGDQHTRLELFGKTKIHIPVQAGYEPVVGKHRGFEVVETAPGEFEARVTGQAPTHIDVPLRPERAAGFRDVQSAANYTQKTGIALKDWPQDLQMLVKKLQKSASSDLEKAAAVEAYLRREGGFNYYSVGSELNQADLQKVDAKIADLAKKMAMPTAMAHGRTFNCDGAAWIGAILLRDYLGVPTRVVGGRTISGKQSGKNASQTYHVSRANDPLHAWVEVWDGKQWRPFDMTPEKNQPHNNSEKEKDESESSPSPAEPEQAKEEKAKEEKGKKGKEKEKEEKKEDEEKKKEHGEEGGSETNKDEREAELPPEKEPPRDFVRMVLEAMRADFAERSLMEAGRERLLEEFLRWAEELNQGSTKVHSAPLVSWARQHRDRLLDGKDETLAARVGSIRLLVSQGNLREAWRQLKSVEDAVEAVRALRPLTAEETAFANLLTEVKREFSAVRHPDSKSFDLVDNIYRSLAGSVSRSWLTRNFGEGFHTLGSPSLAKLASDIRRGNLSPLVRMAMLSRFAEMVLNPEKIPAYRDQMTLFRSPTPTKKQELVVARSPLEVQRMLLQPQPGQHLFEPTFQGKQFAIGSRETQRVIDPKTPIEKKVTVVYFDISGSMTGAKAKAQDALLMNFVDKALSETDPLGNPTHEVYLIPFGDEVYPKEGHHIRTRKEAEKFLSEKMRRTTKTDKSTSITATFVHFYELVAKAHAANAKNNLKQFKRANMILFTDGQDKLKEEEVDAARKKVPPDLKLFLNFVSLDGRNEFLEKLAENSNLGSAKPMVRKLEAEEIAAVVKASERVKDDPEAFASSAGAAEVPAGLTSKLNQLATKIEDFRKRPDVVALQENFGKVRAKEVDLERITNHLAPAQLMNLVSALEKSQLSEAMRQKVALRVLELYPQVAGRPLDEMTYLEKDQFDRLRHWVEGRR